MLAVRSSLVRAAALIAPNRGLTIAATVKQAPDTSAIDFPAPSHVSLASEVADLAQQLNAFYSNPESVISLPDETREALQAEVVKRVSTVPEAELPAAWVHQNLQVPSEIRLGDNPLFESAQKTRTGSK
ncbi:unnamed protein product [Agarophyton chilense]